MRNPLPLLLFALASACGARTEIELTDVPARSVDASVAPSVSPCERCVVEHCVDLVIQCDEVRACSTEHDCVTSGGSASCLCEPTANPAALALLRCEQSASCGLGVCAALCVPDAVGVDAPVCGVSLVTSSCDGGRLPLPMSNTASCEACVVDHCPSFASACGETSECQAYLGCLASCSTASCDAACATQHPDGETAADALDVCLGTACGAACTF